MSLRIFHTADNHIGISFNQYPGARERLIEDRFASLDRMAARAHPRLTRPPCAPGPLRTRPQGHKRLLLLLFFFAPLSPKGTKLPFSPASQNSRFCKFKTSPDIQVLASTHGSD